MFNNLRIDNIEVEGMMGALRGMRNPKMSHHKKDSYRDSTGKVIIGPNDMALAKTLIKAGTDHRKFIRQIQISFDAVMPEYWWKQYHTYKVSTVENSSSQMHTLGNRLLTEDDFIFDAVQPEFQEYLKYLNGLISSWQQTKDKNTWRILIQAMPQSFLYLKTCTMSYEHLLTFDRARRTEKLGEWPFFLDKMFEACPYAKELLEPKTGIYA